MNSVIAFPPKLPEDSSSEPAIARALINSPDIIFADEPTGSLNMEHGTTCSRYPYESQPERTVRCYGDA